MKCPFSHFSEVFTSSNKVRLKKYRKYPILKISKISDIFDLKNIAGTYRANPDTLRIVHILLQQQWESFQHE